MDLTFLFEQCIHVGLLISFETFVQINLIKGNCGEESIMYISESYNGVFNVLPTYRVQRNTVLFNFVEILLV